jgi:phage tail sheath gpL-like
LVENILNDNGENTYFGENSMLAAMIRAAKKENKLTRMDALPLDDNGSGVKATGEVAITGTATAAGTLYVTVGSEKNHRYSIAVAIGDTATNIGAAIETAITADTKAPVTAANVTGTVTLTAVNAGTYGNDIGISVEGSVAGVTHAVTAMNSGATDPVLTGIFDAIAENRYQTIIWPYADDTSEVVTLLDARFNVANKVLDGVAITCKQDTYANHITALTALNSQSLVYFCDKIASETSYKAPAQFEISAVKAAEFGAIRAARLTDGASISQYVITSNGALDAYGGPALASKPYFNTNMPNLPLIATGRGWDDSEIEGLFSSGGSVIGQNAAGNAAVSGEIVTTYKTDSAGNSDISFKFLNYVDTSSQAREYFFNNLRARFAQSRLTAGDVIRGRDQANDLTIKSYCEKLYQDLSGRDYVLVQAGEDAVRFFKQNTSVVLDLSQGRATIEMIVPLVTQLREILATMKIAFSTEG